MHNVSSKGTLGELQAPPGPSLSTPPSLWTGGGFWVCSGTPGCLFPQGGAAMAMQPPSEPPEALNQERGAPLGAGPWEGEDEINTFQEPHMLLLLGLGRVHPPPEEGKSPGNKPKHGPVVRAAWAPQTAPSSLLSKSLPPSRTPTTAAVQTRRPPRCTSRRLARCLHEPWRRLPPEGP